MVVIGASGGIGSALARRLARHELPILLAGRDAEKLEALDVPLGEAVSIDARSFDDVASVFDRAAELGGGTIHGVAHCVGSILLKPAHRTSEQEWNEIVAQNLTSAFAVVRAAGGRMKKGGSVALCSTAAALTGLANHDAIAAAKAGVNGLVRSAAATYAGRGLRFNAVAPGLVDTPLAAGITQNETALEHSRRMHALGRIGTPDDIASALDWLLDPQNTWISGEVLSVDGGLAHLRPLPRG